MDHSVESLNMDTPVNLSGPAEPEHKRHRRTHPIESPEPVLAIASLIMIAMMGQREDGNIGRPAEKNQTGKSTKRAGTKKGASGTFLVES